MNWTRSICLFVFVMCVMACGMFAPLLAQTPDDDWTLQNPLPTGNALYDVSFTDANTGAAVGKYGTIAHTTDGGATWVLQSSGTTEYLYGVSFTDANTGTVVGSNGTILRTTDGGVTWVPQSNGTTTTLWGVSFTDAGSCQRL